MKNRLIILTLIVFLAAFLRLHQLGEILSPLIGSLTVLLSYFLVQEVFNKKPHSDYLSLTTSFLLAISPWHLHLSRFFLKTTLEILLLTLIVWLLLKFIRTNQKKLLLLFPLLLIFSSISGRLTFTKEPAELIISYLSSFTPHSLFLKTGHQEEMAEVGLLYLAELPFLLGSWYFLFKNKSKNRWFLLNWFLIVPLFASLNIKMPFITRLAGFVPLLQILISYGIINFWQDIDKKKGKKLLFIFYGLLFMFNIFYFLHLYFVHWPLEKFNFAF